MRDSFRNLIHTIAEINGHKLERRLDAYDQCALDCVNCKMNLFADNDKDSRHICGDILLTQPCGTPRGRGNSEALHAVYVESRILNILVDQHLISGMYPDD